MHSVALPRTCLGFTNILFFILSVIGCIICVWCMINTEFFRDVNYTVTKSSLVYSIAEFVNLKLWVTPMTSILIPIFVLIMVTSCCGILGSGCKSKCGIKSYILLASLITAVAFWFLFISGIYNVYTKNESTVKLLQSTIQTNYGKENDFISHLWDYVMLNYDCCGVKGYRDFQNSFWESQNGDKIFPIQCCLLINKTSLIPKSKGCSTNNTNFETETKLRRGCIDALSTLVGNNKGKIIFYLILLLISYTILIFFAYCIIRGQPIISKEEDIEEKPEVVEKPSKTSLDNMLFVNEPPIKVMRVVSALNPHQMYKFTPHMFDSDRFYSTKSMK